ncbi:MAG TPA: tetraacyldisaccharide 4'-kinase [Rhizomicrobium sp.]|nr:tetraacyldisaccharide 4'-kinase [Rhizomicrobium sp.]
MHNGFAARLLAPLGALYGASVARKAKTSRSYRAAIPVICVGNLTAGGSGKTPVAIAVAQALIARGARPFFLTRGYGGNVRRAALVTQSDSAAQVGDEALLLTRTAPVIVEADRAEGAALAEAQSAGIIVMDDGHQNFGLRKNLSLIVVDGQTGFGNGRMIPAGPLREPVAQGLARADAVIAMGEGMPDLGGFAGPVLRARLHADGETLRGRKIFAFAGIGRPEKFTDSLRQAGAIITGAKFFSDHHPYSAREIAALRTAAGNALLVTTEKDLVRLAPEQRTGIAVLPVRAVFDNPAGLARLLDRVSPAV